MVRLECAQCQWRRCLSGATSAEKRCPKCGGQLSSVSLGGGKPPTTSGIFTLKRFIALAAATGLIVPLVLWAGKQVEKAKAERNEKDLIEMGYEAQRHLLNEDQSRSMRQRDPDAPSADELDRIDDQIDPLENKPQGALTIADIKKLKELHKRRMVKEAFLRQHRA